MDPLVAQRTNSSSRSPGGSASPASRQYGDGDVRMEGLVTIVLGDREKEHEHEVIPCLRPMLRVKSSDYTWLDENDSVILNHVFKNSLTNHHLWRDDDTQTPWTVDFHTGEMNASEVRCRNDHHQSHHKSMSYEFSNPNDYILFHSKIRGKQFIRDYEIASLDCTHSDALKKRRQWIKLWKSSAETSVTIPVTIPIKIKGSGSGEHWKIKHVEITSSWMKWDKIGTREVKAEVKKANKRSSSSEEQTPLRRNSSSWLKAVRLKQSSPPMSDPLEVFTAPLNLGQEWHKFTLKFSETQVRDDFIRDVTASPITMPYSPFSATPTTESSLSPPASILTAPVARTAPESETPPTNPQSFQEMTPSEQCSDSESGDDSSLDMSLDTPDPPGHPSYEALDYTRVGGPAAKPRAISASSSQFYRKLSKTEDEFRVLRIAQGEQDAPLSCFLHYHSLNAPPKYEAMSYCWGTEEAIREIPDGDLRKCYVSEHLWRALKRLRMTTQDRLVWIDVMCINQQDVDERNHQLLLMRHIYAKALRTIIWIVDFHPDKRTCSRAFRDDEDTDEDIGLTLCMLPGLAEAEHENAAEELRNHVQRLRLQSDSKGKSEVWWRRLWCIQEYHFSANKPYVYIGRHAVTWDHFYDLFDTTSHPLTTFQQLGHNAPKSLHELLVLAGSFNSSDPRDRIFALLGMASAAGAAMPPNYRHSVIRVFEEAVLYLIQESSTVDVLLDQRTTRSVWGRDRIEGIIPTWIPDLTCLLKTGNVINSRRKTGNILGPAEGNKDTTERLKYNAGLLNDKPPTMPSVKLSSGASHTSTRDGFKHDIPRIMLCRAWYFDVIEKRTMGKDVPEFEQSPGGCLIYNSRGIRGEIIDWILEELEYDFEKLYESEKRTKHDLDSNPRLGLLLLDYLLEGRRSHILELEERIKPSKRDTIMSYEHQRKEDLEYVCKEGKLSSVDVSLDATYVENRWNVKVSRFTDKKRFVPERLKPAFKNRNKLDHRKTIEDDFQLARELGNLFAYARGTHGRFYLNKTNFDAPMRKDVLGCSSIAEVQKLPTQFEAGDIDIEFHEYNAKSRERDFFKTKSGFLGLGPACLEVGDKIVVPLSASRPFILREIPSEPWFHTLVGEAVVPSIMSGKWARLEKASRADSWTEFKIK